MMEYKTLSSYLIDADRMAAEKEHFMPDWHEVDERDPLHLTAFAGKVALIAGEVHEGIAQLQRGDFAAFTEEMADVFIRLCAAMGWFCGSHAFEAAIQQKMAINADRPPKHGKLF